MTLVNPKSRSKAFIYQAGATFQFRSDMCYILSCGSWFDFFGAFYYIPHLRFGNEFDIGMKAKRVCCDKLFIGWRKDRLVVTLADNSVGRIFVNFF